MRDSMKIYTLSKSRSILVAGCKSYKRKHKVLSLEQKATLENLLENLDQALLQKNKEEASKLAHILETYNQVTLKKSLFEYLREFSVVILVALLMATLLRQLVFEAYEIPTGSMRPTFREQDNVLVSKTSFGINTPFTTGHLYFDPSLVQRTGIVIFSGDNIDLPDTDSHYLWLFPYKKRYIKRCMAKPGDTVYFYGGKIYGMDKNKTDQVELRNSPWIKDLSYIPFFYLEGLVTRPKKNQFVFNQMHQSIGRMTILPSNQVIGEIYNGKEWIKDEPLASGIPHQEIKTYSDFWGFRNFALSRLLNQQQLTDHKLFNKDEVSQGLLYLEMRHTPCLNYPETLFQQSRLGIKPLVGAFTTIIPLSQKHIDVLMNTMYTARFVVREGRATRYSYNSSSLAKDSPLMPTIPNGTYEFYNGIAYQIGLASLAWELPRNHPIYSRDPAHVQLLYNLGMEMSTHYEPTAANPFLYPARYAYFRDGALCTLGAPIFMPEDPYLLAFNKNEKVREQRASKAAPYIAFKDHGAPLKEDGSLDKDFIETFGLKIPEGYYLTLGDNHAMSADSRVFGFVPEANLQGAPDWIIWPPGPRWGTPPQKPYPWFNTPRLIVWTVLSLISIIWYMLRSYRLKRSLFKRL
ncbi:Signal peptidase I [Neochlamydia sp. AcF95]|nr:Signal peptidase I [Neochlamydia sp. AcF95]